MRRRSTPSSGAVLPTRGSAPDPGAVLPTQGEPRREAQVPGTARNLVAQEADPPHGIQASISAGRSAVLEKIMR